jgi:hypothetical protein
MSETRCTYSGNPDSVGNLYYPRLFKRESYVKFKCGQCPELFFFPISKAYGGSITDSSGELKACLFIDSADHGVNHHKDYPIKTQDSYAAWANQKLKKIRSHYMDEHDVDRDNLPAVCAFTRNRMVPYPQGLDDQGYKAERAARERRRVKRKFSLTTKLYRANRDYSKLCQRLQKTDEKILGDDGIDVHAFVSEAKKIVSSPHLQAAVPQLSWEGISSYTAKDVLFGKRGEPLMHTGNTLFRYTLWQVSAVYERVIDKNAAVDALLAYFAARGVQFLRQKIMEGGTVSFVPREQDFVRQATINNLRSMVYSGVGPPDCAPDRAVAHTELQRAETPNPAARKKSRLGSPQESVDLLGDGDSSDTKPLPDNDTTLAQSLGEDCWIII